MLLIANHSPEDSLELLCLVRVSSYQQKAKDQLTIDSCHNEADLSGIRGAGEMGIDLLCLVLVEGDESVEDVIACCSIVGATFADFMSGRFKNCQGLMGITFVIWEIILHGADWKLLLKPIDLV